MRGIVKWCKLCSIFNTFNDFISYDNRLGVFFATMYDTVPIAAIEFLSSSVMILDAIKVKCFSMSCACA